MTATQRFPEQVLSILRAAGWYPGRKVHDIQFPSDFVYIPAATNILSEFGGLSLGSCGPGWMCATSYIEMLPHAAEGLGATINSMALKMGKKVFPVGEVDHGNAYIFVDEEGKISFYYDELELLAESFDTALTMLLLGILP